MKRVLNIIAKTVFMLAIATPFGGFTKFYLYEPELPEQLKTK